MLVRLTISLNIEWILLVSVIIGYYLGLQLRGGLELGFVSYDEGNIYFVFDI